MNSYTTILFDLDGTLLDTSKGILKSIDETISCCGLMDIPSEVKYAMIGPPIGQSLQRIYQLSDAETLQASSVFRDIYSQKYLMEAVVYPGVEHLLQRLHNTGWKTGVATYKRNDYAQKLLYSTNIAPLCDFVLGSDGKQQTKTEIIQVCLRELGCFAPEHAIMVGDTLHDAEGARRCGMAFVGVTYGFGFAACDEIYDLGALAGVNSLEQLEDVLFEQNNGT